MLSKLSKIYDMRIREKCEKKRLFAVNCLNEQFNDEYCCKNVINDFLECTKEFDEQFRIKYNFNKLKN
tara:strand:- start:210 stop:413 length:204 start_codon:yes stop_codon:yes gene_type:complete